MALPRKHATDLQGGKWHKSLTWAGDPGPANAVCAARTHEGPEHHRRPLDLVQWEDGGNFATSQ